MTKDTHIFLDEGILRKIAAYHTMQTSKAQMIEHNPKLAAMVIERTHDATAKMADELLLDIISKLQKDPVYQASLKEVVKATTKEMEKLADKALAAKRKLH